MLAVSEHHRHPRLAVGFELAIGQAQRVEQVEIEGVALGHPIQTDQEHMAAPFAADSTGAGLIHGAVLGVGKACQTGGLHGKG
ncbi:hypothetical protein D3C78_1122150 [compost metagenome]